MTQSFTNLVSMSHKIVWTVINIVINDCLRRYVKLIEINTLIINFLLENICYVLWKSLLL